MEVKHTIVVAMLIFFVALCVGCDTEAPSPVAGEPMSPAAAEAEFDEE